MYYYKFKMKSLAWKIKMTIFVHKEHDSPSWADEQGKQSLWWCCSPISIYSLWLICWVLTKTRDKVLYNLIHIRQLRVSYDDLEIYLCSPKLFCASMNYFWLLVLFLETEFIPTDCNYYSLMLVLSLLWSWWFFCTPKDLKEDSQTILGARAWARTKSP